jgi:hypothetical protein
MNIPKFLVIKLLAVGGFIALAVFPINAQYQVRKQKDKVPVKKKLPREGWMIPSFSDSKKETRNLKPTVIEGTKVQVKSHRFTEEHLIFLETCPSSIESKASNYRSRKGFAAAGYLTYEIKGKIFAYKLVLKFVDVKNGRITERFGAAYNAVFVDEDNDSRFNLRCNNSLDLESLPEWVKSRSTK